MASHKLLITTIPKIHLIEIMNKFEDRNSSTFKAKEEAFYSDQQIYSTQLYYYKKDMDDEYLPQKVRDYAKQKYKEIYFEKRCSIDKWKEEHGGYDEARTNKRIGEKSIDKDYEYDDEEDYSM